MDGQLYKVVFPNGDQGVGNTSAQAVTAAIGTKRYQGLLAGMPRCGYFWDAYVTRSLVPDVIGKRGTTQNIDQMYEVTYVWDTPKREKLKYTVYRASRMTTIALLPANQPSKVASVAKLPRKVKR